MVDGFVEETVCVFTDLTKIKKFQDELRDARDQALKMAEMRSSFLATVSHELRTPLHSIEGYIELLLDTPLDEEQRNFAKTAFEASVNLNEIINEVLDFSKLEGKAMELALAPNNVKKILEGAVSTLNANAMQKNLWLTYDIATNVPQTVMLDAQRLRQILVNLIGNALKFTKSGGVQVKVQTQAISDVAVRLLFSVIDTGIGIGKEDQQRIFQPFKQVENSTTRSISGTGLGLAIVKNLVELMGGEVGVQSEIGKGSRFWFTIQAPTIQPKDEKILESVPLKHVIAPTSPINTDISPSVSAKAKDLSQTAV
jgi:signal transduction histidine kinase